MNNILKKLSCVLIFTVISFSNLSANAAIDKEKLNIRADLKLQYITDDDLDLGTKAYGWRSHESAEGFLKAGIELAKDFYSYVEVRGVLAPNGGLSEGVSGNLVQGGSFFEWREHWLLFNNILNTEGLSFQFGRQRIKEARVLWWDKNYDMMRVKYKSTAFEGFVGFGENLASYRTLHDDFLAKNKDRFRILGEGIWHFGPDKTGQLRFLYEDDHSKTESVGDILNLDNIDGDDQQLLWVGGRATGDIYRKTSNYIKKINYNIDIIGLTGKNTHIKTVAGPGTQRTVNSVVNSNVLAWAFDAIVGFSSNLPNNPVFSLGYAFGSGNNSSSSTDTAFRQTDLHGNLTRTIGDSIGSIRKYGEVLKPELSNINILTAAVKMPLEEIGDINFLYHYYRLDKKATSMGSKVDAPLDGVHKNIGHAFDIVSTIDLNKEMFFGGNALRDTYLKTSIGSFIAGDAYGAASGKKSYRASLSLWLKF